MPFTLAHPAAAVPLLRPLGRYGSLSGLVVGSMTPDLWYVIPFAVSRNQSHDFPGVVLICLPLGCALYVLYHLVLKHPLVSLLPTSISCRLHHCLEERPLLPRAPWTAVMASVLAGAVSHVIWDAFTHSQGRVGRVLPLLRAHLLSIGSSEVYVATLMQYASGAAGLALLAWWSWRWLSGAPASANGVAATLSARTRVGIIMALLAIALAAGIASALQISLESPIAEASFMQTYVRPALSSAAQALTGGLIAYSALWHMWAQRLRRAPQNWP